MGAIPTEYLTCTTTLGHLRLASVQQLLLGPLMTTVACFCRGTCLRAHWPAPWYHKELQTHTWTVVLSLGFCVVASKHSLASDRISQEVTADNITMGDGRTLTQSSGASNTAERSDERGLCAVRNAVWSCSPTRPSGLLADSIALSG